MKSLLQTVFLFLLFHGSLHSEGLYQAFNSGMITLSGESSSGYSESKLVITNTQSVSIVVDFSTACLVQNNSSQRVGLAYEKSTGSYNLRLSANTTYTLYFSSRCLDASRSSPSTGVAFAKCIDISSFTRIVDALRANYDQASVWNITDHSGTYSQQWKDADSRPPVGGGGGGSGGSNLDLIGPASWAISGGRINIKTRYVKNLSSTGTSGSLRLRIWATRSRYSGGTLNGYVLGTRELGTLRPGYQYSKISGKVTYTRPPSGKYYTTLTLEEFTSSGWVLRDSINFSSRKTL